MFVKTPIFVFFKDAVEPLSNETAVVEDFNLSMDFSGQMKKKKKKKKDLDELMAEERKETEEKDNGNYYLLDIYQLTYVLEMMILCESTKSSFTKNQLT